MSLITAAQSAGRPQLRQTAHCNSQCASSAPRKQALARRVVLVLPLVPVVLTGSPTPPAKATAPAEDDSQNPLVAELLRRTAEKKDERAKERLEDYYRRNYKDYFSFESGNREGLSAETKRRMKEFLEKDERK